MKERTGILVSRLCGGDSESVKVEINTGSELVQVICTPEQWGLASTGLYTEGVEVVIKQLPVRPSHLPWREEIARLRELVVCTECSEELGEGRTEGWLPNLCPRCQGEMMSESVRPSHELEGR